MPVQNSNFKTFARPDLVTYLVQILIQVNLDMTDPMGPRKLVRHMQNLSYTYDEYVICIGLEPSISSVICKNPLYSGLSYPSSPVPGTFNSLVYQKGQFTLQLCPRRRFPRKMFGY